MGTHSSKSFLVRIVDGNWIKGDPFWAVETDNIMSATRLDSRNDAKKYLKTLEKRKKNVKFEIVPCTTVWSDNFEVKSVTEDKDDNG